MDPIFKGILQKEQIAKKMPLMKFSGKRGKGCYYSVWGADTLSLAPTPVFLGSTESPSREECCFVWTPEETQGGLE